MNTEELLNAIKERSKGGKKSSVKICVCIHHSANYTTFRTVTAYGCEYDECTESFIINCSL